MNKKRDYVKLSIKQKKELKSKIEYHFEQIISEMNKYDNCIAPEQHLIETPERISKMYIDELFQGCFAEPPKLKIFKNKYPDELSPVIINKISVKSICSHHFIPFKGYAVVYYIPNKKLVGLSKFSRIIDYFSRRPQIQEELTRQIGNYLNEMIKPHLIGVGIRAQHLCMLHRGANEESSNMETYFIKKNNKKLDYKNSDIQKILFKQLLI